MLITEEWSAPRPVAYGKNISLQYSRAGFIVQLFNDRGQAFERVVEEGRRCEIRAAEISHIAHPQLKLRTAGKAEIHVHIDCPEY